MRATNLRCGRQVGVSLSGRCKGVEMDAALSVRESPSAMGRRTARENCLARKRRRSPACRLALGAVWLIVSMCQPALAADSTPRSIAVELYVKGDGNADVKAAVLAAVEQRAGL